MAGAFGGAGGQSAFGTKAGDVFTKITIALALIWVVLAGVTGFAMRGEAKSRFSSGSEATPKEPVIGNPVDVDDTESPFDIPSSEGDDPPDGAENESSESNSID